MCALLIVLFHLVEMRLVEKVESLPAFEHLLFNFLKRLFALLLYNEIEEEKR